MRITRFMSSSSSGGTGTIPPDKLALLADITVTSLEINRVAGLTSLLEGQLNSKMPLTGGTFTGMLTLAGAPTVAGNLASKSYVDAALVSASANKLALSGGVMTGPLVLAGNAGSAMHAVPKQQLDTAVGGMSGAGDTNTTNIPTWTGATNGQVGAGWTAFSAKLQAVIAENRRNPLASYAKTRDVSGLPGSGGLYSAVLLSDGRVFIAPYTSTSARIYDPATDTVSTPSGTYPGGGAFSDAILLKDGRVFMVPYVSTTARIYDPVTDTLITPAGTYPGSSNHHGGVLLPDGRVYIIPNAGTSALIYDPVANTLTTASGVFTGGSNFNHGVLLPDGRVFLIPYYSTTARIYDPAANTLSTPAGTYPGVGGIRFGIVLPDGRVLMPPYNGNTTAYIYNPTTGVVTTLAFPTPSNANISTPILLPDGRVYLPCNVSGPDHIYDPVTNVCSPIVAPLITTYGAVLLPSGSVFKFGYEATAYIMSGRKYKWPKEFLLSPFFNR